MTCTFAIGLVTPLDETQAVFCEISERIEDVVDGVHFRFLLQ